MEFASFASIYVSTYEVASRAKKTFEIVSITSISKFTYLLL